MISRKTKKLSFKMKIYDKLLLKNWSITKGDNEWYLYFVWLWKKHIKDFLLRKKKHWSKKTCHPFISKRSTYVQYNILWLVYIFTTTSSYFRLAFLSVQLKSMNLCTKNANHMWAWLRIDERSRFLLIFTVGFAE